MSDPEETGNLERSASDIANILNYLLVTIFAIVTYVVLIPIHDYIDGAIDRLYRWVTPEYDVVPPNHIESQEAAAVPQRLYHRRQRTQTLRNASELEGLASRIEETARNQMSLSCGQHTRASYGCNPHAEQETNFQSPEDSASESEAEDVDEIEEMLRETTVREGNGGNAIPEGEQRNVWGPASSLLGVNVGASTSEHSTIGTLQQAGTSTTSSRHLSPRQHPLQGFSLIASPAFSPGQQFLAGGVFWEKPLSNQNPETNPVDGAITQQPDEQTKDALMEDSSEQISTCVKKEEKEDSLISPGTTVDTSKSHFTGGAVWEAPAPELGPPLFTHADFARMSFQQSLGAIGSERKCVSSVASSPETAAVSNFEGSSALERTTIIPDSTLFPDPSGIASDPSSGVFGSFQREETCEVDPAISPAISVDATTGHLSGGTVFEATVQSGPSSPLFSEEDFNRIMSGVTIGSQETIGNSSEKSSGINVGASTSQQSGGSVLATDSPHVASPPLFSEDDFNKMSMQSEGTIKSEEPSKREMDVGAITSHESGGTLLITDVPHVSSPPMFSEDDFKRTMSGQSSETTESEKPRECGMDAAANISQQSSGSMLVPEVSTQHLFAETGLENTSLLPSAGYSGEMKTQSYASLAEGHPSTFEEGENFPGSIERHSQGNRSSYNLRQKTARLRIRMIPIGEAVSRPTKIQRTSTRKGRHAVGKSATDIESTETASSDASSSAANRCATTSSQRSLIVPPVFPSRRPRKTMMPPQAPVHPTEFLEQRRRTRNPPQFGHRLSRTGDVRAHRLPRNRKRVGSPCTQPKKILKETPESEEDQRPDE